MYRRILTAAICAATLFFVSGPVRADDDDNTTATYVRHCRANIADCKADIGMAVVVGGGNWCAPEQMEMPTDAEADTVVSWLEAHPDVQPGDFVAATDAALTALYPCAH
jgi:hypothetical protein